MHLRIGASEIPTLFGVNPFQTIHDLFMIKTGMKERDKEGNVYTRIGSLLEDDILDLYSQITGYTIKREPDKIYSYPVSDDIELVCKLDGRQIVDIDDDWLPVEVKFTSSLDYTKEAYIYQVLAELICVDKPRGYLIITTPELLYKEQPFTVTCIDIEDTDRERILDKIMEFYEYIQKGKPMQQTVDIPTTPVCTDKKEAEIDLDDLCSEYSKINAQIRALEKKKSEVYNNIMEWCVGCDIVTSPKYTIRKVIRHGNSFLRIDPSFKKALTQLGIPYYEDIKQDVEYYMIKSNKQKEEQI